MADFTFTFHPSVTDIQEIWQSRTGDSTFFSHEFYKALEHSPPSGTSFWYGLVYDGDRCVGNLYYQLKRIELDKSLRLSVPATAGVSSKIFTNIKRFLARQVRYTTLVAGNMTLTGTYGHVFDPELSETEKWEIIPKAADQLAKHLKSKGIAVSGILLKDFDDKNRPAVTPTSFSKFEVQPNMVLPIQESWSSTEDYLGAMKSKYKVRVRRARKKAEKLNKMVLSADQILEASETIKSLYQFVADGAGFNLFTLPDDYFWSLKTHLGDKMKLTAYYDGSKMVGFYTSIRNDKELDAHFLGYEPACNLSCQLYLNMLYDLVDEGIAVHAHNLVLSRTAMEIKSSVGAEPRNMYLYMKSTNSIMNRILGKALDYFVPEQDWQPRSPFK